ncbi:uncharacterized protein F4817DRAFT_328150 [Daldinia loculata]|uniref:uncharacterized protein n=1 Tax=Daldinia loculata TaxID=103429 RepID=UPI0020C46E55|nr:uncharacterized protein F4817DRAFT_328150 [Daldinia loculata]KAI1650574.1 hypothetical protein F4817DRAFT_328150 [Daldinia loculata]
MDFSSRHTKSVNNFLKSSLFIPVKLWLSEPHPNGEPNPLGNLSDEFTRDEALWKWRTGMEKSYKNTSYLHSTTLLYSPSLQDIDCLPDVGDFLDTCNKTVPVYITIDTVKCRLLLTVLHNYIYR